MSEPPPRRRRPFRALGPWLFSLLPLVVVEIGLRAYYDGVADASTRRRFSVFADEPGARFIPDDHLGYRLAPGFVDASGKTHHDDKGYRGPAPAARPDRILVAAIGGSTTYGVAVADDELTYPAQLERVLHERTGDDRVEVLNAGVPGYTTFDSIRNLHARVLLEKPRLVVVYHAINDLHVRRAARYLPDNAGYRHPWREPTRPHFFIVRHSYFARWLGFRVGLRPLSVEEYTRFEPDMSAEPPESLLEERPPIFFRENLGELVRTARAAGAEVALTTFASNPAVDHYVKYAFYRRGLAEMNQVIREVAERERTLLVDVDGRLSRDVALWADGVHLDARGSRAHAEIVGDALAAAPAWMKDEARTETKIE